MNDSEQHAHIATSDAQPQSTAPQQPKRQRSKGRELERDRKRTEYKIIQAVGTVLAEEGFAKLGVNKVARAAGVDKVLIYRYFGGLDRLIDRYARETAFWPTADELIGYAEDEELLALPVIERGIIIVKNLIRAIYRRPETQEIIAWRLAERSELTEPLDKVRIEAMNELYGRFVADAEFAQDPVVVTAIKTVSVGLIYMVVATRNGALPGEHLLLSDLESADGWRKLDRVIEHQMRAAVGLFG